MMTEPRRRSWGNGILWLLTVGPVLAVAGFISHMIVLGSQSPYGKPQPIDPNGVPEIEAIALEADLVQLENERWTLHPTPSSVGEAIALLSPENRTDMSVEQYQATREGAAGYLLEADIPPEQHAVIADLLLADQTLIMTDSLALLDRVGNSSHGSKLARCPAAAKDLTAWMDLLDRWQTPLDTSGIFHLVHDRGRLPILVRELTKRGWLTQPAVLQILTRYRNDAGILAYFDEVLSDSDWLAIWFIARHRSTYPLREAAARRIADDPPRPEVYRTLLDSFAEVAAERELLPAMVVLDEPSMYAAAREQWQAASDVDADGSSNPVANEQYAARLVFEVQRAVRLNTPTKQAFIDLLGAFDAAVDDRPWAITDLATRQPELAKQAGISPAVEESPSPPTGDDAQLRDLLSAYRSGDYQQMNEASAKLCEMSPGDTARDLVVRALTPHLMGNLSQKKPARLAFCHWAGPSQEPLLIPLATDDDDQKINAAAIAALARIHSQRLLEVAKRHAGYADWDAELKSAWDATGAAGEAAWCRLIADAGPDKIYRHGIDCLGRIGGRRSSVLLKAMLKDAIPAADLEAGGTALREYRWAAAVIQAIDSIDRRLAEEG